MAHKRDRLPGFITGQCTPDTEPDKTSKAKSCPNILNAGFAPDSCRGTMIIEVVPSIQVQARQDNLTVVGVNGEFWWMVNEDNNDCLQDNVTCWAVWSLIRYEADLTEFSQDFPYNPWDTGLDFSGGTQTAQAADAFGFNEGDFSAPRDRISWQKHQLWEATSGCLVDDAGSGNGVSDFTATGTIPVGNVQGVLATGTGTIFTDCTTCPDLDISGTITNRTNGAQTVNASKTSHMRIHSKARVPLKGNQKLVLQVDFGDPFTDCNAGGLPTSPSWHLSMFGYVRPTVELA